MLGDGRDVKRPLTILHILALTAVPCLTIFVMPHFAMVVTLGLSMLAMYLRSRMPRAFVFTLLGFSLLFAALTIGSREYLIDRITAWFYPWRSDPRGAGYLTNVLIDTWRNSQWIGGTVPDVAAAPWFLNAYPLAYFAAAAGKLPTYLAIALNALVVWRMLHISRRLQDRISSIVSFGASVLMAVMSGEGVLGSFGWLAFDGAAMFISASGAHWLLQGACVAIVFALNLNRDYIRLSQGSRPDTESVQRRLRIRFEWTK